MCVHDNLRTVKQITYRISMLHELFTFIVVMRTLLILWVLPVDLTLKNIVKRKKI